MFCKLKEKPDFINLSSLECDRICSACTKFRRSGRNTKKETIDMIEKALKNVEKIHDERCVRWKGKAKDEAEVQICKNITGKKYDFIEKVLDFEIPISANENENAEEIDNISYNESTKTLFLLELKKENNEKDSTKGE